MASLAEFEHDLLWERVRSGIAAAKAQEQTFGRTPCNKPSDKHAGEVIRLLQDEYLSQRQVEKRLVISKTTVNEIVNRHRHHAIAVIGSTSR
jgi:putative DNA-invertase from lambdoid prophage Rac